MAIDLTKYKLSSNLDKYKIQPEKQPPNYNAMAPA